MSKVEKMSLEEIFNETNVILRPNDIIYFCEDLDVIKSFVEVSSKSLNYKAVREFLIEHEEYINKEKLIILLIKNYTDNLKVIDARKKELKEIVELSDLTKNEEVKEFSKLNIQEKVQSENLKKAIKLARGIDVVIPFYSYNQKDNRYEVDVVDSKELVDGKTINSSSSLKRFKSIDEYFKSKERKETRENQADLGIEYILQSLILTDFYEIFSDQQLGEHIRTMVLENAVLQQGIKTAEELEKIKTNDYLEYARITDNCDFQRLLPEVKRALQEHIQYVDIDKLLLISAYRFEEGLESGALKGNKAIAAKELIKAIFNNIKNENLKFSGTLQRKEKNGYVDQNVEYSAKYILKCLGRYAGNDYLTKEKVERYKEQIRNGEINLLEIRNEYVDIICSEADLEEFSLLNDENFKYALSKLEWDKEKILEVLNAKNSFTTDLIRDFIIAEIIDSKEVINLYLNGKLKIDQIQGIKNTIDLSENVNSYELIQYYKNSIEKDSSEEEKDKFDRYTELYKDILSEIEDKETLEEKNNELVNSLLDNYQGEKYIKIAGEFYEKGLVPLEVLSEWNGEKIIDRFYNDGIISLADIKVLVESNKLSFEYLSNIYNKLASKDDIEYDERLNYIKTGYVSEKEIFRMYEQGLIFEKDLRDLAENGIVRIVETERLINDRTKEDLEKNSSIRLVGLNELTKINNDIYSKEDDENYTKRERGEQQDKPPRLIIDPNVRSEYINLFNAYLAETDLEEDSPFYNYEFYVIPDESGDIGINSVVIAERYYEDKETEEQFALNNATYFFKYKDLMVLSNLKKSEMTKERENVVFTAKHILADENKNGYWAAGVIYGIVKTMLSSDLKDLTKSEQRNKILEKLNEIYTHEEVLQILDMATEIDSGEYTYEIQDPKDKFMKKRTKSKSNTGKNINEDVELR